MCAAGDAATPSITGKFFLVRLKVDQDVSEDTTWRATLGPADLRVIANVTRSAGRRLGYGLPASGSDRPRLEEPASERRSP